MSSTPSSITFFPFKEDFQDGCLQRATTVNDTILSCLKAWILTRKGSRLGNMVGCFLPDMIYNLVNPGDLPALASRLQSDASAQFPGVTFINTTITLDMTRKNVTLMIQMSFTTAVSDIAELEMALETSMPVNN